MDKVGNSAYYELVTEKNAYYRQAELDSMIKARSFVDGIMNQRGIDINPLGNVDNGMSVFLGINYDKLPHYIKWGLKGDNKKPIRMTPV